MPDSTDPAIEYRELGPDDAEVVHALYARVQAGTPYGFLAEQSPQGIADMLAAKARAACVGAWLNGQLVGYLLNRLESAVTGADSPLVRHLTALGQPIIYNHGIAIEPDMRTGGIGSALIRERRRLAASRGLHHALMLVAVDNLASLQMTLRAGSWLVGFERDRYCQNFQVYAGALTGTATLAEQEALPLDDEPAIAARFADGWVANALDPEAGTIVMRRCADLAPA